jgi:hypothetical protein
LLIEPLCYLVADFECGKLQFDMQSACLETFFLEMGHLAQNHGGVAWRRDDYIFINRVLINAFRQTMTQRQVMMV